MPTDRQQQSNVIVFPQPSFFSALVSEMWKTGKAHVYPCVGGGVGPGVHGLACWAAGCRFTPEMKGVNGGTASAIESLGGPGVRLPRGKTGHCFRLCRFIRLQQYCLNASLLTWRIRAALLPSVSCGIFFSVPYLIFIVPIIKAWTMTAIHMGNASEYIYIHILRSIFRKLQKPDDQKSHLKVKVSGSVPEDRRFYRRRPFPPKSDWGTGKREKLVLTLWVIIRLFHFPKRWVGT